jgi:hypothetical protein
MPKNNITPEDMELLTANLLGIICGIGGVLVAMEATRKVDPDEAAAKARGVIPSNALEGEFDKIARNAAEETARSIIAQSKGGGNLLSSILPALISGIIGGLKS